MDIMLIKKHVDTLTPQIIYSINLLIPQFHFPENWKHLAFSNLESAMMQVTIGH